MIDALKSDPQLYAVHIFFFFSHFYFPASGPAVVTGVVPSPPRFLPPVFIAHRAQQSHCSSIFHRMLLTHALALSASQFVPEKKSQRIYTSMHSVGLELTKLTYTMLEDNLIRHRGDHLHMQHGDSRTSPLFPLNVCYNRTCRALFYICFMTPKCFIARLAMSLRGVNFS